MSKRSSQSVADRRHMAGCPMPTTRKPIHRKPNRRITDFAVDIFDSMEALELQCTCPPPETKIYDTCTACSEWWRQHRELHCELKLRPWGWQAYSDYDPQGMARYRALKAASDARRQKA